MAEPIGGVSKRCYKAIRRPGQRETGRLIPLGGQKLGIFPPWQCMNSVEDYSLLKRLGFSYINMGANPDEGANALISFRMAYEAGWNNSEIMLSLPCDSYDKFRRYFDLLDYLTGDPDPGSESYHSMPFYGFAFNEPHFKCGDAWKEEGKRMCSDLKHAYPSTKLFTIGYQILPAWAPVLGMIPFVSQLAGDSPPWYIADFIDSAGMIDGFMADDYHGPAEQIGRWYQQKAGLDGVGFHDKIFTAWINIGASTYQGVEDMNPNNRYFNTLLSAAHRLGDQVWLYSGDLCWEMMQEIDKKILILDSRGGSGPLSQYLGTSKEKYDELFNADTQIILDVDTGDSFQVDDELKELVRGGKLIDFIRSCSVDSECSREFIRDGFCKNICDCGYGNALLCSIYKRRLRECVDAAQKTAWLQKEYETIEVELCFKCRYEDCKRCDYTEDPMLSQDWRNIDCDLYRAELGINPEIIAIKQTSNTRTEPISNEAAAGMQVFESKFDLENNGMKDNKKIYV